MFKDKRFPNFSLFSQNGRSMIEMLAVLAIMGILTIGGIAGYTFAISKHRANQIYKQVDLRAGASFANAVVRQTAEGATYALAGFDEVVENITYQHKKTAGNGYDIIALHVPERVCKRLQDMSFPIPQTVTLNDDLLSSNCGNDNTFVFSYDGLSISKPSSAIPEECNCSGCQSCETGVCRDNDNLCGPKEVCRSGVCQCAPGYTECLDNCYTTCQEGFMRDPATCDCVCEPQECPENATWNSEACSCECDEGYDLCNNTCHPQCSGSGMTGERDPDSCACLCLEGTNADTCACPEGYIYVDDQCMRLSCEGTSNYYCYLNGMLCGVGCTSLGENCTLGVCRPEVCPVDSILTKLKQKHPAGYFWGCRKDRWEAMSKNFAYDGTWCCEKDKAFDFDAPCTIGECLETYDCSLYNATNGSTYSGRYQACIFNQGKSNEYGCTKRSNNTWYCFQNSVICGDNCIDPSNCGTCGNICNFEAEYNEVTNMCEKDGVSCTLDSTMQCYKENTKCGDSAPANQTEFAETSNGNCFNPGCESLGMKHAYIEEANYWGCVRSDGLKCYRSGNMAPINCYYEGKGMCATYCRTYDASDCDAILLEECAPIDEETGKHICPYNSRVTETCVCLSNRNASIGTLCCPPGQSIINGACSASSCPEGQIVDENGFCKQKCGNNTEVTSDCICNGNVYQDNFNRTICCENGYSWNENTQSCS